jgi:predicted metal-dependent hydrolase
MTPARREKGRITHGDTTIPYVIVRSPRRTRTMAITVNPEAGVSVSVPVRVGVETVRRFVKQRAGWIVRTKAEIDARPKPLRFVDGERVSYLGERMRLHVRDDCATRVSVRLDRSGLHVTAPITLTRYERKSAIRKAVVSWYMRRARKILSERVDVYRRRMRLKKPRRVVVKDQRSRWGSCSADGTLRFNWRIVMAEEDLIDYLVVHELLHMRIRSHSPRYRAALARFMPDYRERELRLNEFGRRMAL